MSPSLSLLCLLVLSVAVHAQIGTKFILYSNFTDAYVVVDPTTLILYATGASASTAAVFTGSTDSGDSVSFIYDSNGKFVSADGAGSDPLIANRGSASTWEAFLFEPIHGTTNFYAIEAEVNENFVTVQSDNSLIATSATEAPATIFQLLPPVAATPVPIDSLPVGTQFILYSNFSSGYVTVETSTTELIIGTTDPVYAAVFTVSTDSATPGSVSIYYTLNNLYVSARSAGAGPLEATASSPSTWEAFAFNTIAGESGYYTITALINNLLVTNGAFGSGLGASSSPTSPPAADTVYLALTPAVQ